MQTRIDVKTIREILNHGNTAEVKKIKNGDVLVIEIEKKMKSVTHEN